MFFFQNIVTFVLVAASAVGAAPYGEDASAQLHKRQLPAAPPTSNPRPAVMGAIPPTLVCTGGPNTRSYRSADILEAVQRGVQYINAGTVALAGNPPVMANGYPHNFNNAENFNFGQDCLDSLQEFPILVGRLIRSQPTDVPNALIPGIDRVVFRNVNGVTTYCGGITHGLADANRFTVCR